MTNPMLMPLLQPLLNDPGISIPREGPQPKGFGVEKCLQERGLKIELLSIPEGAIAHLSINTIEPKTSLDSNE